MTLTHEQLREAIRPANFDPADVEVAGFMDTRPPERPAFGQGEFTAFSAMYGDRAVEVFDTAFAEWEQRFAEWKARNVELFGREFPGSSCEHCGTSIRWAAIVRYIPTGQHFVTGETCAEERMNLGSRVAHLARLERMRVERADETRRMLEAKAAFMREHPAEAALLLGERPYDDFLDSLKARLTRYGELTERQLAALTRQVERNAQRAARREAEQAALADTEPLAEGRREIVGEIVSTRVDDGEWGPSVKMLVKLDDGSKVWGTMPAAIEETGQGAGTRVKFTGTVTRSDRDEHFGFFKRPAKAEVIS